MANQKKTSTKRASRATALKAVETLAAEMSSAEMPLKKMAASIDPAPLMSEAAQAVDTPLPQPMRDAIETAESLLPLQRALTQSPAPSAVELLDAGTEQALHGLARVRSTGEGLRQVMTETARATTMGALDVNDKVLEALRAQSDTALETWQSALKAGTLSEAINVQSAGTRQMYEVATARWGEVADSARRWVGACVKPMQSAWSVGSR